MTETPDSVVDVCFPIHGRAVPIDHGHALYGALSRRIQALHGAEWLAVHPIGGMPLDSEMLAIDRRSAIILRIPVERLRDALPLAGATLEIRGAPVVVGAPTIRTLFPAPSLDARLVVIKLTQPPRKADGTLDVLGIEERFLAEARRQLAALAIETTPILAGRRAITVGGRRVVGYSVRVGGLQPDQSLRLQIKGLGGKRTMGCGVFRPTRRVST